MADIRKQLKLIATLDDSSFRKQLESFKREMGKGFKMEMMGQEDLNSIKSAFRDIAKDFADEIKKAIKDLRIKTEGGAPIETDQEATKQARAERKAQQQSAHEQMRDQVSKARRSELAGRPGTDFAPVPRDFSRAMDDFTRRDQDQRHPRLTRAAEAVRQAPLATAAAGVGATVAGITTLRRTLATREQGLALDILQDQGLEGAVRESGRGLNLTSGLTAGAGALGGAALGAKIGAFAGPLGILAGRAIGGIAGGTLGFLKGGEMEGETRVQETRIALESLQRAKQLRQARVEAFAGGVAPELIDQAQQRGTQFGFGPQETLQQFLSARQFLGGRGAAEGLGQMQEMQRRFGVGVEEQARAAEILGGASRAGTRAGLTQTVDVLKKGVAAGLDASKASQFLRTTAEFVQTQTGFAQLDTDDIASRLAQSAFQFARGGEVTQTQLEQARMMQETVRNLSGTTEGLAGGLNILGAQETAKQFGLDPDSFQTLAIARASTEGKGALERVGAEMGLEGDQLQQFVQANLRQKQAVPERTGELLFGEQANLPSRQIFTGQQLGVGRFAEEASNFFETRQFQGPMPEGQAPAIQQTRELQSLQVEALKNQTVFVEGLNLMGRETNKVASELDKAAETIRRAAQRIENLLGPDTATINRSTQ